MFSGHDLPFFLDMYFWSDKYVCIFTTMHVLNLIVLFLLPDSFLFVPSPVHNFHQTAVVFPICLTLSRLLITKSGGYSESYLDRRTENLVSN